MQTYLDPIYYPNRSGHLPKPIGYELKLKQANSHTEGEEKSIERFSQENKIIGNVDFSSVGQQSQWEASGFMSRTSYNRPEPKKDKLPAGFKADLPKTKSSSNKVNSPQPRGPQQQKNEWIKVRSRKTNRRRSNRRRSPQPGSSTRTRSGSRSRRELAHNS